MKKSNPPEIEDPEIIRRAYPELTRCVVCNQLPGTVRGVYSNDEGQALLTIWVHKDCLSQFRKPNLKYQYEEPPRGSPQLRPSTRFNFRRVPRRKPVHDRCFCCESHEPRDHKIHRRSLGYSPKDPWPGRLEPGELI